MCNFKPLHQFYLFFCQLFRCVWIVFGIKLNNFPNLSLALLAGNAFLCLFKLVIISPLIFQLLTIDSRLLHLHERANVT